MKLKMHDELISMELPKKMIELSAIAFSPMKSINISMKRKFSPNGNHHGYRPHLTSASSDVSNEEHHPNEDHDDEECEDDDSRASSTLVGNGDLVKTTDSSKLTSNNINLPSPPSSTRSSFDNDGVTRDSFISSGGDNSDNVTAGDVAHFGSITASVQNSTTTSNENTDNNDVILEGHSELSDSEHHSNESDESHENESSFEDDIKLVTETLVNMVAEDVDAAVTGSSLIPDPTQVVDKSSPPSEPQPVGGNNCSNDNNGGSNVDIEELWKDFEIDFEGETILPSGLRLIKGMAEMEFCRDNPENGSDEQQHQFRFTNQLNFLKNILTKYICRYKTAMPFLNPVDSVRFKIPHYYKVIRQPMDLNTVKNRLNFLWYRSADECISDLRLIFSNCYQFNSPTDYTYTAGKKLEDYLDEKLKDMPQVEVEIPCPPRPSIEEYQKLTAKRKTVPKIRADSISEHSENGDSTTPFGPIKVTTRSERGVMVRKPSKDLPAPISTPQPKAPTHRRVPLNEPMKYCHEFVKELFSKKHADYAWPFWEPVNVRDYPDYAQKIKKPVDLSSIKTNIETGRYITVNDFANDMRLMFSNCLRYNTPESPIIEQARKLRDTFEYRFARIPDEWLHEKLTVQHHHTSSNGSGGRNTSPSVRLSTSILTPSSSKHQAGSAGGEPPLKIRKSATKTYSDNSGKKSSKSGRNSMENSGHAGLSMGLFNPAASTSGGPDGRMEMLERQVANLTNALQACLVNGMSGANPDQARSVLMSAMLQTPPNGTTPAAPTRGRPRKNGYQASQQKPKSANKKAANSKKQSRKRKHHLSSDEDSDSDEEMSQAGQMAEPFDPESIEDLKKLKNDLENLRAKDLQNVLRILQSTEPSLRCDDESNVEIDFEALKPKTLVALRKYVTSCMLNAKASPSNHSASASNHHTSTTSAANSNKKFCQSSNSLRSTSINDTDCDNSTINNWSRAGSRASDLQLSESSSSDSELDD